jgi:protein-disulfide isomerase
MYVATGRATMVFRDFAFLGQESFDAAVAARCAGQQDTYWHYHDLAFASQSGENQGAFARERLVGLASFAALDEAAFTACLDDPAVLAEVEADTAEGRTFGVSSTPTIRIVGPMSTQIVTGLKPLSEIEAAVERSINEPPAPSSSPSPSIGASASPSDAPSASPSPAPSPAASPSP